MNISPKAVYLCEKISPTKVIPTVQKDVERGLFEFPRSLPPKYFYDEAGSLLFDKICDAPEYYPTRTESALLEKISGEVIECARPDCIIELGSGTSRKTRHLLNACDKAEIRPFYAPVDVCDEILLASRTKLTEEYPWLKTRPISGDYTAGLGNLPYLSERNLVVFLGGTIGNFTSDEALAFLRDVRSTMGSEDYFLIGADRMKSPASLHEAYNDTQGVTAAFNLNVLSVMNRELDANFDLGSFSHYAYFNPVDSQIEMHLISMSRQVIEFKALDRTLVMEEGEHILTEISRKFTRSGIEDLLEKSGFTVSKHFESNDIGFSLILAQVT